MQTHSAETPSKPHGSLRIFLGAVRGVGKTYAMLEAAQAQASTGKTVVIGWLARHARPELEPLRAQFETIPPLRVSSHGAGMQELDLDRVLARAPNLVLIDELAHTNAPGARHPQRYLDVLEILDAGIDVYTTLNVQHIEGLNDTVARITGIRELETVPDSLLEQAEITVIDLAPEELLQRLREGKVYVPEKDAESVRTLYRIGNLTALRELALRRTADRVDEQMRVYMQKRAIEGPWQTRERVMVCLDADAQAARLVRAGHQMATSLRADWLAVHIQNPRDFRKTLQERQQLEQALTLAAAQGAQVVTLPGQDVVTELLKYARAHNVTKLVVGKHFHSRWRQVFQSPLADELIRGSGDMNVFVVTTEIPEASPGSLRAELRQTTPRGYLLSFAAVVGATLIGLVVRPFLAPTNIALVYLLAVVLSATSWGLGPAIFSSIVAVLIFDILFVPPYGTFAVHDAQYILTFFIFLIVGILISELGSRLRAQVRTAQQREQETAALYTLSQSMSRDTTTSLDTALEQLSALLNGQAIVLQATNGTELVPYPPVELSKQEKQVAEWSLSHKQVAGHGTATFPNAERLYLPLVTAQGTLGLLSVLPGNGNGVGQDQRLLETFAGQVAIALEHSRLSEQAEQAHLLEATDRFRNALLSSLSHDLRTPLASILGSATSLLDEDARLAPETRHELLETIREEATRLNRYVANLLNLTRLESGTLKPRLDWNSVEEVVGSALARFDETGHPVQLQIERDLPLIPFDSVLIEQVLVNLLDNAYKFSPPAAPIEIEAGMENGLLVVKVLNQGTTVPAPELDRIFEKFYQVPEGQSTMGQGLGLAIVKGIVEAHDGTVFANQRVGGGMQIGFRLPRAAQGREGMSEGALVLIVDDEPQIRRFLRASLAGHAYQVIEATNGKDALNQIVSAKPDLVILDLGLPDMDGLDIIQQVREWSQVPIVVLSVREREQDKIAALDRGADDYLTKPFGVGELLARLRTALRHVLPAGDEPIFQTGELKVDLAHRKVTVGDREVSLTPTEYSILKYMVAHAGKVVTHRQLLQEVWGPAYVDEPHYLRVYVGQLRHKIEQDPAQPRYLLTETGVGYRLAEPDN